MVNKPISELIVKESAKRATLKSREVLRWSGQTEIESSELLTDSLNIQQTNTPYDMDNKAFLTPFEVVEPELSGNDFKTAECETITSNSTNLKAVEQINHTAITEQVPACPRCQAAMVKRVAKKGQHQGKDFFGCSQFPKCWGVVNVD